MCKVNLDNIKIEGEIYCKGIDEKMQEALKDGELVKLRISSKSPGDWLQMDVECKYNCGGHGERCSAKYVDGKMPDGTEVLCPYSRDIRVFGISIQSQVPKTIDLSVSEE